MRIKISHLSTSLQLTYVSINYVVRLKVKVKCCNYFLTLDTDMTCSKENVMLYNST